MTPAVAQAVRAGWGVDTSDPVALVGGEDSEVWRCGAQVVRVHPAFCPEAEVRWCQAWATAVGAHVPEVVQPLPDRDGATLRAVDGQAVEVVPYVVGAHLDPADAAQLDLAADLLLRLAAAAQGLDLGPRLTWDGRCWDPQGWAERAQLPDPDLDAWYDAWSATTAVEWRPPHHDVHQLNVLVREGRIPRITAPLDHDDARIAHPDEELAQTSWDFDADGWRTDPTRGPALLDAVEALGRPVDRDVVRRLVRVQLRRWIGWTRAAEERDGDPRDTLRQERWAQAFARLA